MSCLPIHFNVPRKQWNGVSCTNCEEQKNQHTQPTTLATHVNQHLQPTTTTQQQQCHLFTTIVQNSTKVNKQPITFKWGMWINQQLENAINEMERGHTCSKNASRYWNIMLTLLLDHLNGRIRIKKVGPQGVLMK